MDNTGSKDMLDMDDFDMDELLTEFAEEENKTAVVELSDSEDELGKLVDEFVTTLSDSEDDEKKTGAKVILSPSDDEIDNLLDGFNEEDSSESEPVQVRQEALSEKDIDCGTYDENKKSIIIKDSNTQNDTFYDSAVEIIISDENTGTPVKASVASNLSNSKTNESQPASSLSAININNYSQKQELEKYSQNIPSRTNSADSTQNCSKENVSTYRQQSNENFERNNQNKNPKDELSSVSCNDLDDVSQKNNMCVPVKTLPTNENLGALVNSVIGRKNLKKNPSPLSITNVTILCDENVLKPKNSNTSDISMEKIIEHAIDECMKQNLKTSPIKTEQESTDCNASLNTNTACSEFQENSSEVLPVIDNVRGSECNIQRRHENSISNCDSDQQKNCKSIAEDKANSTFEDSAKMKSNTFSLAGLSIKSEAVIKPTDSSNCLKNLLLDNSTVGVKMENSIPTEKKLFQDVIKSENCLSSEKNNYSFSKSVMTENIIYQEQPNIPKIAVEIKIHISSEENNNIYKVLNESILHPSEKTENTNSKTADVSIKLNGLADKFLVPITNVTDKPEALLHSNSKNDSSHKEISKTLEFKELKAKDLDGASDNTCNLSQREFKKRKLETSDCEIKAKKLKQEACSTSTAHKPQICDITSFILTEINEALPSDLNKKVRVSIKGLDYLVLQVFQKTFNVHFHQELSEAEKLIKELEEKSANLSKTSDLLLSSFREFRSIQKEAYVSNSYKKISNRTVGINVKIINAKEQQSITKPANAVSKKNKNITKENEVSIIKETGTSSLQQNVSVIKENKETSSQLQNVSVIKENKETSSQLQNVVPINSQDAPVEEKKVIELSKTSLPVMNNKEVLELPRTGVSKNLLPNGPNTVTQMEQKTNPFMPKKFSPPNVIQSGNRLIPYLNPTKRVSAPLVHVLSSSKPVTNTVSSGKPVMKSWFDVAKQTQHNEKAPSTIYPGTSVLSSTKPVTNKFSSNPIMKSLLDMTEQTIHNERTQGNNSRTGTSPQNQLPKISKSATMSQNQPLQLGPSARSEAPNVMLPFRSTASSVAPTVTINKDSYGIPQNHPVMRNMPSVSEALRNQILHLQPSVYSDARTSIPVFTKSATGIMQNKGPYPASIPQFSQSYLPQLRQMAARNVPATAVANPSAPSSRVTQVFVPPPAVPSKWTTLQPPVQSKLTTPPPTPPISHYVCSKQQIPPLPEAPSYDEALPKPTLKVTKEETDVILSWNVDLTTTTTTLSSYQIYSCNTSNQISQLEVSPVWKKIGDVAAMQLPMAVRLRKFEKHNSYHFVLRVVDGLRRLGPFSDCASVDI